ncbi:homoserine O-acetyltransferase MetX [Acuticoccus kandeliae]|uniref:homoserine O-acetyltransferase MetX n=1 Tax=Acuticoccus kandeliae TaxID=2073160 RepID=UPI00130044C7|nr:homoserine O-acetyltransferase [Acuticoccus kandeliae]
MQNSFSPPSEGDRLGRRVRTVRLDAPLALTAGGALTPVDIVFETYGRLNARRDNAILVLHGLTGDHHAAGPVAAPHVKPGWWDGAIGPGRALDTDRFCVIAPNAVGGAFSTGPHSPDPATGAPYGLRFPVLTIADMARAGIGLADALGIERVHALVGGCFGGFQILEWLAQAPERVGSAAIISATARTSAHNLALFSVLRAAIMSDPAFRGGDYYDAGQPAAGLGLLAMTGALHWMGRDTWERRFGTAPLRPGPPRYTLEPDFAVDGFLAEVGANASRGTLDANSLLYLTRAIDYFDMARDHGSLEAALAGAHAPVLLVSYETDWRYPPAEMAEIGAALPEATPCRHLVLASGIGHGAFLYEFASLEPHLRAFIDGTLPPE